MKIDYKPAPLSIIDNGHTIQVNETPGGTQSVGGRIFTVKQFHFHHPREERVGGKGYDLVAHLVHADTDGRLAVVAVLFATGAASRLIATLWQHIPAEKREGSGIPLGFYSGARSSLPRSADISPTAGR